MLAADKAYDTNEVIAAASEMGMESAIPPKSNRKEKRDFDWALYKCTSCGTWWRTGFWTSRSGAEWRPATRSGRHHTRAACQLQAVMIWSELS